jgi:hypothetical protein
LGHTTIFKRKYIHLKLKCINFPPKMVVRPKHVEVNLNKIVNNYCNRLNLGCLSPVARVISYDVGFNPSTPRLYREIIYYLYIYIYIYIYIATCFGRKTIIKLKNM